MKKLYNDYMACTPWKDPIIKGFDELVNDCAKKILEYAKEHDLHYREACTYTKDTIDVHFSEAIIRRALQMQRDERKKLKDEHQQETSG